MTGTRPDLCYIVTKLSQKLSKPSQADLSTVKWKWQQNFLSSHLKETPKQYIEVY